MAISRTAVVALLLPVPAVVYLATSMGAVNADSQCLPSAHAVLEQYPGSWAAWSAHVANHRGVKCWFPVMRENHSRHIETALHRTANRLMRDDDARREQEEKEKTETASRPAAAAAVPVAYAAQRNDLPWVAIPAAAVTLEPQPVRSSFEDRFSASREAVSGRRPSVVQHMMDPVGVIPDTP